MLPGHYCGGHMVGLLGWQSREKLEMWTQSGNIGKKLVRLGKQFDEI